LDNSPSSNIWVSELNARPEIRSAFPRSAIRIYDTTLRDKGILSSPLAGSIGDVHHLFQLSIAIE
jgi:hypothetical protein